jgi:hypothetical protein
MPWFALVSSQATLAVDIYRSRERAEKEMLDAVEDEPDWIDVLSVVPIDLPEPQPN